MDGAPKKPLVIAHRGACGYLPEHTLEAYQLGAELGADYLEPDLVFTRDGHLIARHDHYLSTTTDIALRPEFADRKTTRPGHQGEDWFTEDFTLEEIKTLKAVQARPDRSKAADGLFGIPTFAEVVALAQAEGRRLGRMIGVYPETKLPGYFAGLGFDYPAAILKVLNEAGWAGAGSPVFIQSFEAPVLKDLRQQTDLPLVFLAGEKPAMSMTEIAGFADGLGPYKALLVDNSGRSTGFLEAAHAAGLQVHPWTFRSDDVPGQFLSAHVELDFFFRLGVDGVFADFPETAVAARAAWQRVAGTRH